MLTVQISIGVYHMVLPWARFYYISHWLTLRENGLSIMELTVMRRKLPLLHTPLWNWTLHLTQLSRCSLIRYGFQSIVLTQACINFSSVQENVITLGLTIKQHHYRENLVVTHDSLALYYIYIYIFVIRNAALRKTNSLTRRGRVTHMYVPMN